MGGTNSHVGLLQTTMGTIKKTTHASVVLLLGVWVEVTVPGLREKEGELSEEQGLQVKDSFLLLLFPGPLLWPRAAPWSSPASPVVWL